MKGRWCRVQAGLLIAETEFALQVESDIAPYKGLLMGLFFMTVGMEISVGLFFARIKTVLAGILGLLIGKVSLDRRITHCLLPAVRDLHEIRRSVSDRNMTNWL